MSDPTLFREATITVHDEPHPDVLDRPQTVVVERREIDRPAADVPAVPGYFAARGLGRLLGLHPTAAVVTILVDLMLFGGELLTMGLLVFFSLLASMVLGWIVYRIQKNNYGDDHSTALTKAVIVGLVTAIPTPVTPLIAVPGGLVGAVSLLRRRRD